MIDTYCIDYDDYLANDNDDDEYTDDEWLWWYQTKTIMVMPCFLPIGEDVHWNFSNLDDTQIQLLFQLNP